VRGNKTAYCTCSALTDCHQADEMSAGIKRQSERLKKKGKVKPFRKGLVTWQFAQPKKKSSIKKKKRRPALTDAKRK
jgi:hypothetical protein